MKDNYLWDRSGEPDYETQELEEILGTLRYQPQPLEIPTSLRVRQRRRFFPAMAIAAVFALFAIALGLWFNFNRRQSVPLVEAGRDSHIDHSANAAQQPSVEPAKQTSQAPVVKVSRATDSQRRHRESSRDLLASNKSRGPRIETRQPKLNPQELAEKEQVLLALRLVSAKLNLAQRKTQGAPQLNTIRNQHKIG